ncbi:MAG: hypothetical protein HKP35_08405 [Silicimonas sp.]|nr:hypothetical protein [Silicimonas sp.]
MLRKINFRTVAAAPLIAAALLVAQSPLALADTTPVEIGGDLFLSGDAPEVAAERDVFAVGLSTALSGSVDEDAHAVGFSVEVDANTDGDLYAAGGSVSVRGAVGSDLNVTGGTIRTHGSSRTGGNARISGGSVSIEGPIDGALIASGGEIYLNAPIGGDARLSGARIRFGSEASVAGRLTYSTGEPIDIPESVADPSRVTFEKMAFSDAFGSDENGWDWPRGPDMEIGAGAVFGALAATIGSFLLVGAIFLAFAPALVSRMRKGVLARPGKTALAGLIGLSILIGCIPILAMTLVGIPLVPIAILATVIVWYLGYVLGAYALGMGVARGIGMQEDPSILSRLGVLAVTALVAALLNFIPILGWLANFAIVILGVGAMTFVLFERILPDTATKGAV